MPDPVAVYVPLKEESVFPRLQHWAQGDMAAPHVVVKTPDVLVLDRDDEGCIRDPIPVAGCELEDGEVVVFIDRVDILS